MVEETPWATSSCIENLMTKGFGYMCVHKCVQGDSGGQNKGSSWLKSDKDKVT